ncbi:MAG TPA: hypothetical protein VEI96_08790 [Thermodesulfovibrionales bacterium]|nr:hypothetical protein [Thermodesulfovibrionales bacterium]
MKTALYRELICKGFCPFHKDGRDDLTCGTYNFLERILTARELEREVRQIRAVPDLLGDRSIRRLICGNCDFLTDGCGFREGTDSRPCGGFTIVEWLMRRSFIPFDGKEGERKKPRSR